MIIDARNYIANRLIANSLSEFENPYADGNIPASQLDKSFVCVVGNVGNTSLSSNDLEVAVTVNADVNLNAYLNVYNTYQDAATLGETLIKDILTPANQVGQCINGVSFVSMELVPFENEQNDNIIVIKLVFEVRTFIKF